MTTSKKIVLKFPNRLVGQPIIYRLVKDFDLSFNILKAMVTPEEEGVLVLELSGAPRDYEKGLHYLSETGVVIQPLSKDIVRDNERCTHCGACVTVCPAGAFEVSPRTRQVAFLHDKCIACELCIKACPLRAMRVNY